MVPVDVVPVAVDPMAIVDEGEMLMVASGTVAPPLLLSDDGSLVLEVVLSVSIDGGSAGIGLGGGRLDAEGSTDATGAFCGFRISRCGL